MKVRAAGWSAIIRQVSCVNTIRNLVAGLVVSLAVPVSASTIYVWDNGDSTSERGLYAVDAQTGAVNDFINSAFDFSTNEFSGSAKNDTRSRNFNTLTYNSRTNTLFGIADGSRQNLVELDPATRTATRVASLNSLSPALARLDSIAFNPVDGLLYGAVRNPNIDLSDILYSVDLDTLTSRELGPVSAFTAPNTLGTRETRRLDIAFDELGNLYGFAGVSRQAVEINLSTLQTTWIGDLLGVGPVPNTASFRDVAFEPGSGRVVGWDVFDRRLEGFETTTGNSVVFGGPALSFQTGGIAVGPSTAAATASGPATAWLVALSSIVACQRRRTRRGV